MTTKLLGVIGGMSPTTTTLYYTLINNQISSILGPLHSANLLIRSLDYASIASMVTNRNWDAMTDLLIKSAHELKSGGAQAIVLCANVAHKSADDIERKTGLRVLHIVDFTAREIVKRGIKRVGLLGTRSVMEDGFYAERLKRRYALEVFVPGDEEFRRNADAQIFGEMSKDVVPGIVVQAWKSESEKLVTEKGVEGLILGCTELRLILREEELGVPAFETTKLHARGVAEWVLGRDSGV